MDNKAFSKISILVVFIILIGGVILAWQSWRKPREEVKPPAIEVAFAMELENIIREEDTIREVVILFGQKIKHVDKVAPEEYTREGIEKNYSGLISSELYSKWTKNPAEAPGRVGSSPWPNSIKIKSIIKAEPEEYQVNGFLLWVTSSGIASEQKLILTMAKENERWVIAEFIPGELAEPEKPGVEFLSPRGEEKWQIGETYEVKWTTPEITLNNGLDETREKIVYFHLLRKAPGGNILFLDGNILFEQGYYGWTVPEKVPNIATGIPEDFPQDMVGVPVRLTLTIIGRQTGEEIALYPLYTIESEEFVIISE